MDSDKQNRLVLSCWRSLSPTDKQEKYLIEYGLWRPELTRGEASELLAKQFSQGKAQPMQ